MTRRTWQEPDYTSRRWPTHDGDEPDADLIDYDVSGDMADFEAARAYGGKDVD